MVTYTVAAVLRHSSPISFACRGSGWNTAEAPTCNGPHSVTV